MEFIEIYVIDLFIKQNFKKIYVINFFKILFYRDLCDRPFYKTKF